MAEAPLFSRVRVTVIDAAGCGEALNRQQDFPLDIGVNSLSNASQIEPVNAPALQSLGLTLLPGLENMRTIPRQGSVEIKGAYGVLTPTFKGNGSPEGHQALMGHIVENPYLLFDKTGFPQEVVDLVRDTVSEVMDRKVEIVRYPGTDDVNGVKFINTPGIGDRHYASKEGDGQLVIPIYASSDSLIQIALHEGVVPYEKIKEIGKAVRKAVNEKGFRIARIIMRPFEDDPDQKDGSFRRVSKHRIDFGVDPDELTLIDFLKEVGIPIHGVGKAASMLNFHGFDEELIFKLDSDERRMESIVADFADYSDLGPAFSFDNLVGLDELFGHRRKAKEYIDHFNMLAKYIAQGMLAMAKDDLWIITADHGNDPTQHKHNNHTNEMVPIFVFSPKIKKSINLGARDSYADVAKTVAENFRIADKIKNGKSFLRELI
ncbi:hypothetical protein A3E42_04965 [Candidatus Gottesmanbacteria bacterium RIFCSPHIGHO2_12_FULL_40_13]|nr:MAG: hypothetical protein A3E42_04965 [Candidatus Gottesmanbacteria bacterium RIFCSPHIGHO2_12_FULL_40_13]